MACASASLKLMTLGIAWGFLTGIKDAKETQPATIQPFKGTADAPVAFRAFAKGGAKVYRLRNRATGAYLPTTDKSEVRSLKRQGWKSQGAAFRMR